MKNFLRTLFGIRAKRKALPITPAPQPGASIVRNGYKIKVTQPCSNDLWDWLLLSGWRVTIRNDRRACTMLPEETFARLSAAPAASRETVLAAALDAAKRKPKSATPRATSRV